MYSLVSHFFPVSIHYLQCIHCLLHYDRNNEQPQIGCRTNSKIHGLKWPCCQSKQKSLHDSESYNNEAERELTKEITVGNCTIQWSEHTKLLGVTFSNLFNCWSVCCQEFENEKIISQNVERGKWCDQHCERVSKGDKCYYICIIRPEGF